MATKFSRSLALVAAASLVAGSGLLTAAPASAAPLGKIAPRQKALKLAPGSQIVGAQGMKGATIGQLQAALIKLGYLSSDANTSYYGTMTTAAVKKYQAAKKLQVNGNVNRTLFNQIIAAAAAVKTPVSTANVDSRCKTGARVLCVNRGARKMYYLNNGTIKATYDVRTGRPGYATRLGQYRVYMKDTNWYSTLYHVNMPYSMFFDGGEAVHYSVDFATNGYGVGSHGCVNMRDWNGIKWLYSQIQVGDKVVVYN